jgi:arabinose-5-phosphate isomerase
MITAAATAPQTRAAESATLALAREVLETEAAAVRALVARLDERFLAAVRLILACRGRVVVSGMGKSGHIGRKIASTLASTGTPAFFMHPGEASHGDLGMITGEDVLVALSHSGESAELLLILPLAKRAGAKVVAVTGSPGSSLGRQADVVLDTHVEKEACPLNLAPTASTTAALAMGDALAVALLDARGFGHEDFARSHPGGSLGRKLLTHVADLMHTGTAVPAVRDDALLPEAVLEMSRGRLGMTAVLDPEGKVAGVFTDGDLRRTLERVEDFKRARIVDHMTRAPRSIAPDRLAAEAVQLMDRHKINQLLVVDGNGSLVGALNMHDLLRAGVL